MHEAKSVSRKSGKGRGEEGKGRKQKGGGCLAQAVCEATGGRGARTVMSLYSDLPYIRLYSALMSRRSISLRDTMMRIRVRSFVPAP